jgi:hypothetical protein
MLDTGTSAQNRV